MKHALSRRQILRSLGSAGGLCLGAPAVAQISGLQVAGREVEIRIAAVSAHTVRLTLCPLVDAKPIQVPTDGSLMEQSQGMPANTLRANFGQRTLELGGLKVDVSSDPLVFVFRDASGRVAQELTVDPKTAAVSFRVGASPLLGLGEGGPQFDRRGSVDRMRSGQGGYRLETHGGRVPVPWLIGTEGWALFFHQPHGWFDLTGAKGWFRAIDSTAALPLDLFVVTAGEPADIMAEYARLTGLPEMPPLWSLGYQQSHRTLANREEVLAEARTFREKKLPCDAFIYLSTGFCPSGWNTENGSFSFNRSVFPDPKQEFAQLHAQHIHVVLHSVILSGSLRGTVHDPCSLERYDEEEAGCYWNAHRRTFALGVDGWWPDEGDPLDVASRLVRNRMYWDGPQIDRPNERPFALHRNGYAGMQRFAAFLWSGDVDSTWETLRTHIPVAVNTGLSGIPYWGTDIGGFVPTRDFTGELYVRWVQFGAFCPLFRAHGRAWKLRLPWGWNTGETGPAEISGYGKAALPDPSELHNAAVEPICRKYLELRYRLLPYLYSAVRESCRTGLPVMRALWLHYPNDPIAVARGDEYLWGRDILVAPVVEKAASVRRLYLPRANWYDFWTGERVEGGREIERPVDLSMMPLYVRAGTILPLGPVRQYVDEKVDEPLSLTIYPGADGSFTLYEDDGRSFNYRAGEWMGIEVGWEDRARTLALRLADGSRMLSPSPRTIEVRIVSGAASRKIEFDGRQVTLRM
jgi:alpha-glucosidase (family GH31 glycosyl hydrolase)